MVLGSIHFSLRPMANDHYRGRHGVMRPDGCVQSRDLRVEFEVTALGYIINTSDRPIGCIDGGGHLRQ